MRRESDFGRQDGFSLVSLMVTAAMGMTIMMSFISMMQTTYRSHQTAEFKFQVMDAVRELNTRISNREFCTEHLNTYYVDSVGYTDNLMHIPIGRALGIYNTKKFAGGKVILRKFWADKFVPLSDNVRDKGMVELVYEFESANKVFGTGKITSRYALPVELTRDHSPDIYNKIKSCGSLSNGPATIAEDTVCDSRLEGYQKYNSQAKLMEFCNGQEWTPVTPPIYNVQVGEPSPFADLDNQFAYCDPGDTPTSGGGGCPLCNGSGPGCGNKDDLGSWMVSHPVDSSQRGWTFACDLGGNEISDTAFTWVTCQDYPPYRSN